MASVRNVIEEYAIYFEGKSPVKILFLTRFGVQGASSRMRIVQYLPGFESTAIESVVSPLFDDAMLLRKYQHGGYSLRKLLAAYGRRVRALIGQHQFDLVWIEKEALPWFPAWLERWLLSRTPYVMDFDDAIFHSYDLHHFTWVRRVYGRRIDRLMEGARLVITGNRYLADRAVAAGTRQIEMIPTVVDLARYQAKQAYSIVSKPCIVWIGSPSTVQYLLELAEPLGALAKRQPFTLRVIGGGSITMPGVDIEVLAWTADMEAAAIAECDVGIMPLRDTPWEQGKCAYKLIQYMACGLPTVASPIGANLEVVIEGETGFFADTASAWVEKMELLLCDAALRQRLGHGGRVRVDAEYCLQRTTPRLARLLTEAGVQMNSTESKNLDTKTVAGFGDEWERFDQSELSNAEREQIFNSYFSIFPWNALPANAIGFDMGCGSGRWAKLVAPRVDVLHCIDPSSALDVAKRNLAVQTNCVFHTAGVSDRPLPEKSMDFGYSLGVLHHVPDTAAGIAACTEMLKPGAPFLLYLYYAFDNRSFWFRWLWRASDIIRRGVSHLPHSARYWVSQVIAVLVYWPDPQHLLSELGQGKTLQKRCHWGRIAT
jgi:glycosyltransferase involved in cell wall biosynthesis/SAM-dependent methyltransferase